MTANDTQSHSHASALRQAARTVAAAGLSDAFGHLSIRTSDTSLLMTPPIPLGAVDADTELAEVSLTGKVLPAGAPKEAWMHTTVLAGRPELGAACRAQPSAVAALIAAGRRVIPATGHLAMLGGIAVHDDSRLIRDQTSAAAVAGSLGRRRAVVLTGNGAFTVGPDLASAVATMWVLEQGAQLLLSAHAAGSPAVLPAVEQGDWLARADELLPRIYAYLLARGDRAHA